MARAFSTSFPFNGKTYAAVITEMNGLLSMYVPDESLHELFPRGKAIFNPEIGLKIDRPRLSPAQKLILAILTSIEFQITPSLQKVIA